MSSEPVISTGSRAVLIGVPDYQGVKYLSYPAVGNSVDGMYELLVESGFCGWREEQVSKIVSPANAGQLLLRLRRLAEETTGVLLLYFVGHGVLSEQGELCLAVSDTDHSAPDATGLEYTKIKRMLHTGTTATTRIVILDCCYSGRAIGLGSADQAQLADLSEAAGAYTLTAADDFADASLGTGGAPRTAFTGELLDLLTRDGIPGGPADLTLGEIYPRLCSRLGSRGLPRPNQRADDQAAAFVFARNAALPPTSSQPSPAGAKLALQSINAGRDAYRVSRAIHIRCLSIRDWSPSTGYFQVELFVLTADGRLRSYFGKIYDYSTSWVDAGDSGLAQLGAVSAMSASVSGHIVDVAATLGDDMYLRSGRGGWTLFIHGVPACASAAGIALPPRGSEVSGNRQSATPCIYSLDREGFVWSTAGPVRSPGIGRVAAIDACASYEDGSKSDLELRKVSSPVLVAAGEGGWAWKGGQFGEEWSELTIFGGKLEVEGIACVALESNRVELFSLNSNGEITWGAIVKGPGGREYDGGGVSPIGEYTALLAPETIVAPTGVVTAIAACHLKHGYGTIIAATDDGKMHQAIFNSDPGAIGQWMPIVLS
jgi:hypothetical protein